MPAPKAATRTQVYLSEEQREQIDALATAEGVTMAEVIRRALDAYLGEHRNGEAVLADTFGSVPKFSIPPQLEWRSEERRSGG